MKRSNLLLFFLFTFVSGEDYFISFTYTFKNYKIIHIELNYSKALTKSNSKIIKSYKIMADTNSVKYLFKNHKDEIIDTLSKGDIVFYQNTLVKRNRVKDDVIKITYPPRRFDISFDGYVAIFSEKL